MSTERWLLPMLQELRNRSDGEIVFLELEKQAAKPFTDWLAENVGAPPGSRTSAVDWIRFGQLLREHLGWEHYPELPELEPEPTQPTPPTAAPPRGTEDTPADSSSSHEHSGPVDDMPGLSDVGWQKQILADVQVHGPEAVLKAMVETANVTVEQGYTEEAMAALQRHKRAPWALPRVLALDPEGLRLIDSIYLREWVCELDGVTVDGHAYADGQGSCSVCGQPTRNPTSRRQRRWRFWSGSR